MHVQVSADLGAVSPGRHVLRFENRFEPGNSVYLANALLPRDLSVVIRQQDRDARQSRIDVSYDVIDRELGATPPRWLVIVAASAGAGLVATGALIWMRRRRQG